MKKMNVVIEHTHFQWLLLTVAFNFIILGGCVI